MDQFLILNKINAISNLLDRLYSRFARQEQITFMQWNILHYLSDHSKICVIQHDFELQYSMRSSTVSRLLTAMQQEGLIKRTQLRDDAKCTQIVITPLGSALLSVSRYYDLGLERVLFEGLTHEEKEVFIMVIHKVFLNLDAYAKDLD